jgi:formamidopyrimidine-DNA glycosylase
MPELPEVETIARGLRCGHAGVPPMAGMQVERVTLHWPRHVATPSPSAFRRRMRGRTICDVRRRGKYLVFPLDHGTLLVHLKMSGDLRLAPAAEPNDRFDRTILHLSDGWDLRFSDARKFGKLYLLDQPAAMLSRLGPEPLEKAFTPAALAACLTPRRRCLKPALLDQTIIAGIGNIYADEALFRAGLHPLRRTDSLTACEIHDLWRGIRAALRKGLRCDGASIDWVYRGGDFQNHFRVYQRTGLACYACGTPIARTVIGQRGTHFCPTCQPEQSQ